MTKIISMSLDEKTLSELDALEAQLGFSGRSETIRAGVRALFQESKMHAKLSGTHYATLTIVHHHHDQLTKLIHEHRTLIKTHLHNHLPDGNCLDIFVLAGEGSMIKKFTDSLRRSKKIEHVSLTVC